MRCRAGRRCSTIRPPRTSAKRPGRCSTRLVRWLAGCELEVRAELRAGDPVQVILGEARRLGCELIVIGHRHLGRLERLLDPSVGDRVIREAPCPVLVEVREGDAQGS